MSSGICLFGEEKRMYMVLDGENIRNLEWLESQEKYFKSRTQEFYGYTLELDYLKIRYPEVTITTGMALKKATELGFKKIIIKNHYNGEEFLKQPTCRRMIEKKTLEVEV